MLQVNMRLKALVEIYILHSFAPKPQAQATRRARYATRAFGDARLGGAS
jgi:hypothetical protein